MIHQLAQLKLPWGTGKLESTTSIPMPGTIGKQSVGGLLSTAIPLIFAFAGLGLLLMLLSSGFTYLTSAGDAKKMEQAKQTLTNAIIGFLIIFVAYWVVQLAGIVFGLKTFGVIFK